MRMQRRRRLLALGQRRHGVGEHHQTAAQGRCVKDSFRCNGLLFVAMRCLALPQWGERWQRKATQCKSAVHKRMALPGMNARPCPRWLLAVAWLLPSAPPEVE